MKTEIYFKNYDGDAELRDEIATRLERLEKYFPSNPEANVVVSELRELITIEITMHVKGTYLRVEVSDKEVRTAIDRAVEKLEIQLKKYKSKLQTKLNDSIRFEGLEDIDDDTEEDSKIVKSKKFAIKPMSPEEASLQMELLGHLFYVFINASTDDVNVIYKRKDGHYGLIEPEF